MKKHFWIPLLVILWLVLLFIPIPHGIAEDGGTRDYISLTYRLVNWNRITTDGVFSGILYHMGRALSRLSRSERGKTHKNEGKNPLFVPAPFTRREKYATIPSKETTPKGVFI